MNPLKEMEDFKSEKAETTTEEKKSKITVFISAHASDFLKSPINGAKLIDGKYNIDEINTNIRILPYAGRTCCVSFSKCDNNSSTTIETLNSIKDNMNKFKRENPENESTYDMLNYIADSQREKYKDFAFPVVQKKKSNAKSDMCKFDFEKTEKCLSDNQHLQIVTPFIDQNYKFYDRMHSYILPNQDSLGIYVLDIQNPPEHSHLRSDTIINDILKPTGETKILAFGSYEDANNFNQYELDFLPNPPIEVKRIFLSELIDYLTNVCGFEIVNIIHIACRTFRPSDFASQAEVIPYMDDINAKESETRSKINRSLGGKSKTKQKKNKKKNKKTIRKYKKNN